MESSRSVLDEVSPSWVSIMAEYLDSEADVSEVSACSVSFLFLVNHECFTLRWPSAREESAITLRFHTRCLLLQGEEELDQNEKKKLKKLKAMEESDDEEEGK